MRILRKIKNWLNLKTASRFKKFRNLGSNIVLGKSVTIRQSHFISIGDNSFLGDNVTVSTSASGNSPISIGKDVLIAQNVIILGGNHEFADISIPIRLQGEGKQGPISIGDDVWIGARSTILTGVSIGKGAVIGAGALVNNDIPEYAIAVGVPAIVIKYRK